MTDLFSVDGYEAVHIGGASYPNPASSDAAEALEAALPGWRLEMLELLVQRALRVRARLAVTGRTAHALRRLEAQRIGGESATPIMLIGGQPR